MTGKRKRYAAEFKAKVALEALRGELTTAQLATKRGVHQTMVSDWKRQVDGRPGVSVLGQDWRRKTPSGKEDRETAREDRPIGGGAGFFGQGLRSMSTDQRRQLVDWAIVGLSIVRSVRAGFGQPLDVLPGTGAGDGAEPDVDAAGGRAVPGDALVWLDVK